MMQNTVNKVFSRLLLVSTGVAPKEVFQFDTDGLGDSSEGVHRDVFLSPLHVADVGRGQLGFLGEAFLRQAAQPSIEPDAFPEDFAMARRR